MPLYAIIATDRKDAGGLRGETRPAHLDHLNAIGDRLHAAGPLDDEGGAPMGSLVIVDMADRAAAQAFADADPYAQAGLFADVRVIAWRRVLPA